METHRTSLLILVLILIFAVIHSGGAALRSRAEAVIGPRLWRLLFVSLSLPSAVILILIPKGIIVNNEKLVF